MVSPGRISDYVRQARAIIREHGWMIQGVFADEDTPSYSYSVGLSTSFGHPEIVLVGFHPNMARSLLNVAGRLIKGGQRFDTPMLADRIIEDFLVAFGPVGKRSMIRHSAAGRAILGRTFHGMQMLLPNQAGRFPWDPGCDPQYAAIQTSLLGVVGDPPQRP